MQPPFLVGLPAPSALARDFGAFIVPFGVSGRRLGQIQAAGLGTDEVNILSLLGFPDFFRASRAAAARRPGGVADELQEVLGEQATIAGGDGDGDVFGLGELPLVALALVMFASLLLVGAVLPPGVVSLARVPPATFARLRQPLTLAAIGILVPVAVVALIVALT